MIKSSNYENRTYQRHFDFRTRRKDGHSLRMGTHNPRLEEPCFRPGERRFLFRKHTADIRQVESSHTIECRKHRKSNIRHFDRRICESHWKAHRVSGFWTGGGSEHRDACRPGKMPERLPDSEEGRVDGIPPRERALSERCSE